MAKVIKYSDEGRKQVYAGINQVANVVKVTM